MDLVNLLQYAAALAFVLALIFALSWAVRRYGLEGRMGVRAGRRLSVVETLVIDNRRRLLLVRCDEHEHLILLGQNHDLLIERGLQPSPGQHAPDTADAVQPPPDDPHDPSPSALRAPRRG